MCLQPGHRADRHGCEAAASQLEPSFAYHMIKSSCDGHNDSGGGGVMERLRPAEEEQQFIDTGGTN